MMRKLKMTWVFTILIFAQATFSKSIKKKHNKKESIPNQRSHYLLLMGNPIEDVHHHKGLGMILSSKHGESEKLKDTPSKEDLHHYSKQKSGLVATLQSSLRGSPSDRGYSYTEALFTGAPLLNGVPFTKSGKTQTLQKGSSTEKTGKGSDNPAHSYESQPSAKLNVDKNGSYEGKGNDHVVKVSNTGHGFWGFSSHDTTKESHPLSDKGKGDHTNEKDTQHQFIKPRPSLDVSPYKSDNKVPEPTKYTKVDQTADTSSQIENLERNPSSVDRSYSNPMKSYQYQHEQPAKTGVNDHPVERVHQILVTGETQENFPSDAFKTNPSVEEKTVNNKIPEKTYIKAYDEESHLLGSSVLHNGRRSDHDIEGHRGYNPNVITGSSEYWRTHDKQTEYSPLNTVTDPSLGGVERLEKETGVAPLEESRNASPNGFKINEGVSQAENTPQQQHPGYHQHNNNYGQHIASHLKDGGESDNQEYVNAYKARQTPKLKSNDSFTMRLESSTPSQGSPGFGSLVNQLRPHKIIESAFDEELTHRIIMGPSYEQSGHSFPKKPSTEKQTNDIQLQSGSHNTFSNGNSEEGESTSFLPYREGDSRASHSQENEKLPKPENEARNEPSPPISGAVTDESPNNSQNEEETLHITSDRPFLGIVAHQRPKQDNSFTNDVSSQKESTEESKNGAEHEPDANYEAGQITGKEGRQPLDQHEAAETMPQISNGEENNTATNNLEHAMLSKDQGQPSAEVTSQRDTSHYRLSGKAVDTTSNYENTDTNSQETQQKPDEQTDTLQGSSVTRDPGSNNEPTDTRDPGLNNEPTDHSYKFQQRLSNEQESYKENQGLPQHGEGVQLNNFGHTDSGDLSVEASSPTDEKSDNPSLYSHHEKVEHQDRYIEGSSANPVQEQESIQGVQQQESSPVGNEREHGVNSDNSNFSENSPSRGETNEENFNLEAQKQETFGNSNADFAHGQVEQLEEAISPARVELSSGSNTETLTEQETSHQPEHKESFSQGFSKQDEEKSTKPLIISSEQETVSTDRASDSTEQNALHDKQIQIKVGNPEEGGEIPKADQSKDDDEGKVLIPFYRAKTHNQKTSQEIESNQSKGNDQENRNQRIVYFLKMAKGIPLLNTRKVAHHPERNNAGNREPGEHSTNKVMNQDPRIESTPETDVDVNGGRRYPWSWQRKPSRLPSSQTSEGQRPSPSSSQRPQPEPYPSPSPSPPSGGGGALGGSSVNSNEPQPDSEFEQEALKTHNKYRKVHGVQEMTLDRDLSNQAKAYAQKIANMGQLLHSSQAERGTSTGENLAYACASNGTPLTGESATKMWYDEVCKPGYNFASGGFSSGTGHFTQVVWKDSVKLGIGQGKATQNGMQCIYVVGRYDIAGNMMGEFQDQVLRGNFNKGYCRNIKKK
ncbi:uncharacterized protein LOC111330947 [Stylophora pistillata]|uniref:uncharacterized protein LOC111330947 n=1 Tax=Stylophora pistillata TaxID=50429 RepID=UPI000C0410CC|nr:uncharacterized protein LOC111330947 [Stylophora pistillata]